MNCKTKTIQKDRKITRNQKKNEQKLKNRENKSIQKRKSTFRGKKLHLQNIKGSFNKNISEEPKIQNKVIDLNLGQYGFDSTQRSKSYDKIYQILRQLDIFSINPNIQGVQWRDFCQEVNQRLSKQNYLISYKNKYYILQQQLWNIINIDVHEFNLWNLLHQELTKIKYESKVPGGIIGLTKSEIQNAKKIVTLSQNRLSQINRLQQWTQIKQLQRYLCCQILYKTYANGLAHHNIDQLNYFLQQQFKENNRPMRPSINQKKQKRIQNWQDWSQFIKKKRVRLRKANKFLLHTACQLCLSPYFQLSNPLTNCSQCHARGHKLCFRISNYNTRCGRCIYLRLPKQAKKKIPQCILCSVKDLVPIKLTGNNFVHLFCLISHGIPITNINQDQKFQKIKLETKKCKFCKIQTNFYGICRCCNHQFHYLCAFMNGVHFIKKNNQIEVECCSMNEESRQKLSYQRRYILNHDDLVFKKLAQVQQIFKSKKKRVSMNEDYIINQQPNNSIQINERQAERSVSGQQQQQQRNEDSLSESLQYF